MSLNSAIKNKATQLFGNAGFTVASLIRRPGESCALSAGQSYGTSYEALSVILGPVNAVTQSLCNSDFSATLSQISNNMVTEAANSYVVSGLQDNEAILSVTLVRAGLKTLLKSSDYEIVRATVTLTAIKLQAGDTLEIEIGPGQ